MKLVLIEWIDSHSGRGWQALDDIKANASPVRCRSVGWLVADTKDTKVLVPHLSGVDDEGVRPYGTGDIAIPRRCIVRCRVLSER